MTDERDPGVADLSARRERLKNGPTPLFVIEGTRAPCHPHRFALDEAEKTVTCKRCEREFTAFDALEYIARDWSRYGANLEALKQSVERLRAEEKDLKRHVQNLRAQVKRREGSR